MTPALHNARLDLEGASNVIERALGRGGAPVDLNKARAEIPKAEAALQRLRELLEPGAPR